MQITKINSNKNISHPQINTLRNKKPENVTFTGWNFFGTSSKKLVEASLESDLAIFSPKQLQKIRKNLALEVDEMFQQPPTPGLVKRLNKILESPFIDYKTEYLNNGMLSLADRIAYNSSKDNKGSELYRQFVLKSLSETMPLELLEKDELPSLTYANGTIRYLLNSYSKMDEASPQAQQIRKMVKRFSETGIPIHNKEMLCAQSILSNQPEMSKIYIENFNLTPESGVEIIREKDLYDAGDFLELSKHFKNQKIMYDSIANTKFFIIDPDEIPSASSANYFKLSDHKYKMSLYKLSGLAQDKDIYTDEFQVIPYLKSKIGEVYSYPFNKTNAFRYFINNTAPYHPQLKSAEFWEKYALSCEDIKHLLHELPKKVLENNELEKLEKRINDLKSEKSVNNEELIKKLSDLYSIFNRF